LEGFLWIKVIFKLFYNISTAKTACFQKSFELQQYFGGSSVLMSGPDLQLVVYGTITAYPGFGYS
jgi:hypothetical protein